MAAAFAVLTAGVAACERIGEPWVVDDQYLKSERSRAADLDRALRDRLVASQADR